MIANEPISPRQRTHLRRLALTAQGLQKNQMFGRGVEAARKVIRHLGYVQVDTIAVVERAHHHVIYSRVPGFKPAMTNQMLRSRDIFEYWAHAAAFLPMEDFRFSLPYKQAIKSGQTHWYKQCDKKLMQQLLARIRSEGPLRSRDIESENKQGAGWWQWKPAKKALEQLYMQGDLMVCDREGFQKTYDLTERVLPATVNTTTPSTAEFAEHLVNQQLRCHGLLTLKSFTYLRRDVKLRQAVKQVIAEKIGEGVLSEQQIGSGDIFFVPLALLQKPLPRISKRMQILSPFDNCVIQRERLQALFQYRYQIECYLPETKRRFGYFCLPLLYGDRFIGRMDCKAHRQRRELEIKSLHFENQDFDFDEMSAALCDALEKFRNFQQCDRISLTRVEPKKLRQPLLSLKLFQ